MALDKHWQETDNKPPFANFGLIAINGEGHNSPKLTLALHQLEYETCLFLDSDDLESLGTTLATYRDCDGKVVCWKEDDRVCTEQRIVNDIPFELLDSFLALAIECRVQKSDGTLNNEQAREKVLSQIKEKLNNRINVTQMQDTVGTWGLPEQDIRKGIGLAAGKSGWFKRIDVGEKLGEFICSHWAEFPDDSDLILKILEIKAWAYHD